MATNKQPAIRRDGGGWPVDLLSSCNERPQEDGRGRPGAFLARGTATMKQGSLYTRRGDHTSRFAKCRCG